MSSSDPWCSRQASSSNQNSTVIVNVCIVYQCPVLYKSYMLDKIAYCVLCRQQFPLNDKSSHTTVSNLTKLLRNVP